MRHSHHTHLNLFAAGSVAILLLAGCGSAETPSTAAPEPSGADQAAPASEVTSSFGSYESPDPAVWDGMQRSSRYIPAADGTKLAIDVFLPTREGATPTKPVPVVLHYTRYIRAQEGEDGELITRGENDPILKHLLSHGYAVAVADARGTGASYGVHHGAFSVEETEDSYAIIEWLAAQPWSNGKVGMAGRSYPGMTQYQAATQAPPALKAIFPEMAGPTAYDFINRGGAYKQDFVEQWGQGTQAQDLGEAGMPAKVDEDLEGVMRAEAIEQHKQNLWARDLVQPGYELRNFSVDTLNGGHWSWDKVIASIDDADAIAASGVGIYHLIGWYDIYTTQQAWMYATLEGRANQKMMIGPWVHSGGYGGMVHKTEMLRWYDYWLKDIDNGVLDDNPVHYFVMNGNHTLPPDIEETAPTLDEAAAEDGTNWLSSDVWPVPTAATRLYLDGATSGTVASVNDGTLTSMPPAAAGADTYTVDYTSRKGSFSRWMNGYGTRRNTPAGATYFDERSAENEKALTYTTAALSEDMTIVGYPTAHLVVSSDHTDGDVMVYLEEIDTEGRSHYITEGVVRASHRKTSEAPFNNFGLPYHRSYAEDLAPLTPGEPTLLEFDIMGTAIVIDAGHRLRLTIAGADAANFALYPDPQGKQAPTIQVHRGAEQGSHIILPVVSGGEAAAVATR